MLYTIFPSCTYLKMYIQFFYIDAKYLSALFYLDTAMHAFIIDARHRGTTL